MANYREKKYPNGWVYICSTGLKKPAGWCFEFTIFHPMREQYYFEHVHDVGLLTEEEFIGICDKYKEEHVFGGMKASAYKFPEDEELKITIATTTYTLPNGMTVEMVSLPLFNEPATVEDYRAAPTQTQWMGIIDEL